jgi:hypothetical protein
VSEILINGFRRGVSPKQRYQPRFRCVCVLSPNRARLFKYAIYRPMLSKSAFLSIHVSLSLIGQNREM